MELKTVLQEIATTKFKTHELHDDTRNLLIESIPFTAEAGRRLQETCYGLGLTAGWWHHVKDGTLDPNPNRNVPEMLMLIVSELSEALEGYRQDKMDDKLPHRTMFEVELADAVIRIADLAGGLGLDLGGTIAEKCAVNVTRKDHSIEARMAAGGKKI